MAPRLSWQLQAEAGETGKSRSVYQILVASSEANLAADTGDLWDRGKEEFGFTTDEEATEKSIRPSDGFASAIENGVFLISVHGTADRTLPYVDNAKPVAELWEKSGGRFKLVAKEGGDHHPHGLPHDKGMTKA